MVDLVFEFRFPDVGEGITEGQLVKWLVKEGDRVKADQPIAEIETAKAVVELPSPRAGTIAGLNAGEGQIIKVGQVLVSIAEEGEKAHAKQPAESKAAERYTSSVVGVLEEAPPRKTAEHEISGKVLATPAVRRLAKNLGVDLKKINGSGLHGQVLEKDLKVFSPHIEEKKTEAQEKVQAAGEAGKKAPYKMETVASFDKYGKFLRIPLTMTRRTIAERMAKSWSTKPHAVEMDEADVTDLWAVREKEKEFADSKGIHLTFLPFIVRAAIAALRLNPYFNATFDEEKKEVLTKSYYNIGVAIDTPHGLMVPVIRKAEEKSILEIGHEIEVLGQKARDRSISIEEMQDSTFTITNYGSIGGTFGVPIINFPEIAILGVGRITERAAVKAGKVEVRKILPLSLSFDHRVVDGAQAAQFMKDLVRHLEDPNLLLIDIS
ncbi:MAG: dihydrolipoamide acetyltransferase family protein [Candidatus Diapherotrites archaeon]